MLVVVGFFGERFTLLTELNTNYAIMVKISVKSYAPAGSRAALSPRAH